MKSIILLLILTLSLPLYSAEVIKLRADDWCPFTCDPQKTKGQDGILPEIAKEALQKAGYLLDYKIINWARALDEAAKGEIEGVLGAYHDDVPHFIFPMKAQYVSRDCFYSLKKNNWKYTGVASLRGKKIGSISGYGYGKEMDDFKSSDEGRKVFQDVSGENGFEQNLKKTNSKRIDAFIENFAVFEYNKKTHPEAESLTTSGCIEDKEIFIALSPKNKAKSEKIKRIIDDYMKNKKAVDAIVKKYISN